MSARKKVLRPDELKAIAELQDLGVPLVKILRDRGLDVSRLHVMKLLTAYRAGAEEIVFPPWLAETGGDRVCEEPADSGWVFLGVWPKSGKWLSASGGED